MVGCQSDYLINCQLNNVSVETNKCKIVRGKNMSDNREKSIWVKIIRTVTRGKLSSSPPIFSFQKNEYIKV